MLNTLVVIKSPLGSKSKFEEGEDQQTIQPPKKGTLYQPKVQW